MHLESVVLEVPQVSEVLLDYQGRMDKEETQARLVLMVVGVYLESKDFVDPKECLARLEPLDSEVQWDRKVKLDPQDPQDLQEMVQVDQ